MPDAPILADLLRRPGYLKLLVICGLVGIPVSVVAFGYLALEHEHSLLLPVVDVLRWPEPLVEGALD